MKIYTKSGDQGQTGLFGGPRVWKDDPRIEAYGTVDELNAVLGLVRADPSLPQRLDAVLEQTQHELFAVGAELATPQPSDRGMELLNDDQVKQLEAAIDEFESQLPPLRHFILPGGSPAACRLHIARSVCRRAERRLVTLARQPPDAPRQLLVRYLNRLSDLLFVLARAANAAADQVDVVWVKPALKS